MKRSINQPLLFEHKRKIQIAIKREDLLHPIVSGNKFRKLKYNIAFAKAHKYKTILTFGGAFSNHIAATAAAGKMEGLQTIGVIRGEELGKDVAGTLAQNTTLRYAVDCGMELQFVSRGAYREKDTVPFRESLKNKYGNPFIVPEGGTNDLAIKGCTEILTDKDEVYDFICCSVGTGGTIVGLIHTAQSHQTVLGFPALKGSFLDDSITKQVNASNWELMNAYHFGGYGKINETLITFINKFKEVHDIPLDPIYTGKMMYGIFDLIAKDYFPQNSRILAIHTGGLQGVAGMNARLEKKGLPLIKE